MKKIFSLLLMMGSLYPNEPILLPQAHTDQKNVECFIPALQTPVAQLTIQQTHFIDVAHLSPDTLIGLTSSNSIIYWDYRNNIIAYNHYHEKKLTAVAGLNEHHMVTGDRLGTLDIWDIHHNKLLQSHHLHAAPITRIRKFDAEVIASCSQDRSAALFNSSTTQVIHLTGHTDWVNDIIQIDTKTCATCSDDGTLKIWDISHGTCTKTIVLQGQIPTTLAQSDVGHLAIGTHLGHVIQLNTTSWTSIINSINCGCRINDLVLSSASNIITASTDHAITIWNQSGTHTVKLHGHTGNISRLITLHDDQFASCSHDGSICLWQSKLHWPSKDNPKPTQ